MQKKINKKREMERERERKWREREYRIYYLILRKVNEIWTQREMWR